MIYLFLILKARTIIKKENLIATTLSFATGEALSPEQ
jgi:hypothetical protein